MTSTCALASRLLAYFLRSHFWIRSALLTLVVPREFLSSLVVPSTVNPVTGTYWKPNADLSKMSEDEQERSAEELMSLIDRLNRNGIIRCELPPHLKPPNGPSS